MDKIISPLGVLVEIPIDKRIESLETAVIELKKQIAKILNTMEEITKNDSY